MNAAVERRRKQERTDPVFESVSSHAEMESTEHSYGSEVTESHANAGGARGDEGPSGVGSSASDTPF